MSRWHGRSLACLLSALVLVAGPNGLRSQADPAPAADTAIAAVVAELDARFSRGDVTAYLAAFEPDHPGAHALLRQHLARLVGAGQQLRRTSTLVTPPRQIGPRTVVRIRHTLQAAGDRTFVEDTLLALRRDDGGRLVPTFAVEIPTQWGCVRGDQFRCPACNYQIGGIAGWLCVPVRPERAQALEAASFYLIGTDVACDVSVRIDPEAPTAATVARSLADALVDLDPNGKPGPVEAWLPPAHAAEPPAGFAAARLDVTLPRDFGGDGGVASFHVVTFGGLQHLLLVRGSDAALRRHAAAVQALLASYRLLQTDVDLALAAARPLQHHTGGTLSGERYENTRFGFELTGPPGWRPQQHSGGAALRVAWASPDGSRFWLTGYDVPPGLDRWSQPTADRWLLQLLQRAGLDAQASTTGADAWAEHVACGGSTRTLRCVPRGPAGPGATRERVLHVVLQDDVLLVADLLSANAADAEAMQAALRSLRRP